MTRQAILCDKYKFDINVPLLNEKERKKSEQSYLHFISERQDLVSAKCLATEWLLNTIDKYKTYSVREYFAGVGLQSTIIQNLLKIKSHKVSDIDLNCYKQLKQDKRWEAKLEDGHKALLYSEDYNIKLLDFPHSSIIHLRRGKWSNFLAAFVSKPQIVIWTDTSMTYSIKLHGDNYANELNVKKLYSFSHYFTAMSEWLFSETGYSITEVAYRAKNAAYIKSRKGKHKIKEGFFPLNKENLGFKILC